MMHIINIDGSCGPKNPGGKGTIGIYSANLFRIGLCVSENSTNNRAEYCALYGAISIAERLNLSKIHIRSDSAILCNTFNNKNYKKAANATLHHIRGAFMLKAAEFGLHKLQVEWVPREQNVNADELTKLAHSNDVWEGLEAIDKNAFVDDLKALIVVAGG